MKKRLKKTKLDTCLMIKQTINDPTQHIPLSSFLVYRFEACVSFYTLWLPQSAIIRTLYANIFTFKPYYTAGPMINYNLYNSFFGVFIDRIKYFLRVNFNFIVINRDFLALDNNNEKKSFI